MVYIYPAYFYEEETGGYSVIFPDLNDLATCGDSLEDALTMAEDAMGLYLFTALQDHDHIPEPTPLDKMPVDKEAKFTNIVKSDLNEYAKKHSDKAVKKTLSIPMWLNTVCEEKNINFSKVLQDALLAIIQTQ